MDKLIPNNRAIIVPIDFSITSENALKHAADHANVFKNDIVMLHIIEESYLSSLFGSHQNYKNEMIKTGVELKLEELKTQILAKYPNLKIDYFVYTGKVYKAIVEIAEKMDCDCIIMGTNGAEGIEHIIGSTSSRVMSYANVPVFIVNEFPKKGKYEKIVLPIDQSIESKQKVTLAIHIAKKYNSEVHIICEVEDDEFLRNRIKATIYQVKNILEQNNVKCVVYELGDKEYPGKLGDDTLKYADEINADLILIMTHQDKGFSEYLFGSEAQHIVNRVKRVPVMCIHPKETGVIYEGTDGFY
ncbi:MAG: universal stress protein [Bacteroidia bacterium]|nr:universal stress protein [Bacteroidia bacterium]